MGHASHRTRHVTARGNDACLPHGDADCPGDRKLRCLRNSGGVGGRSFGSERIAADDRIAREGAIPAIPGRLACHNPLARFQVLVVDRVRVRPSLEVPIERP
jgi:hypothetical protein